MATRSSGFNKRFPRPPRRRGMRETTGFSRSVLCVFFFFFSLFLTLVCAYSMCDLRVLYHTRSLEEGREKKSRLLQIRTHSATGEREKTRQVSFDEKDPQRSRVSLGSAKSSSRRPVIKSRYSHQPPAHCTALLSSTLLCSQTYLVIRLTFLPVCVCVCVGAGRSDACVCVYIYRRACHQHIGFPEQWSTAVRISNRTATAKPCCTAAMRSGFNCC